MVTADRTWSGMASALPFGNSAHTVSREKLGESFLQRMAARTSPREHVKLSVSWRSSAAGSEVLSFGLATGFRISQVPETGVLAPASLSCKPAPATCCVHPGPDHRFPGPPCPGSLLQSFLSILGDGL